MAFKSQYEVNVIVAGAVGASPSSDGKEYLMDGTDKPITYTNPSFAILVVQAHPDNSNYIIVKNSDNFTVYLNPIESVSISVDDENPIEIIVYGDSGDKVQINEVS